MKLFKEDHHPKTIPETTEKLLMSMASLGCSKELIAMLLDLGTNPLSKNQQRFLQGPIIQHKSPWQETTPKRMYEAITQDRLKVLFEEIKTGSEGLQVGPIELMTVMYPATCDAPIRHELAQIYLRAGSKVFSYKHGKAVEEFWNMVDGHKVSDHEIINPKGQYHYEYKNLCAEIRKKVIRAQKQREQESQKGKDIGNTEIYSSQMTLW